MISSKIALTISQFIFYMIVFFGIKKMIDIKVPLLKTKNIVILIIISSLAIYLYNADYKLEITIFTWLMMAIGYKFIFNISYLKSVIISLVIMFSMAVGEIINFLIFGLLNVSLMEARTDLMAFTNVTVAIWIDLLINIKFIKKIVNKLIKLIDDKSFLSVLSFAAICILGISLILNKIYINVKTDKQIIIYIGLIIIFVAIITIFVLEKIKLKKMAKNMDELMEYIETVENWMDQYRMERHENKNTLITVKSMAKEKDEKIIDYINSLLDEPEIEESKWITRLGKLPSGGLKGFVYYKIIKMHKAGIDVNVNISKEINALKFEKMKIEEYKKLCRIMGVFLDNAMEAAEESKEKKVGIEFLSKENEIDIIISNTFKGSIEVGKVGLKGYSKKGIGRGFGLSLVEQTIASSKTIEERKEIINNYYIQKLYIKTD